MSNNYSSACFVVPMAADLAERCLATVAKTEELMDEGDAVMLDVSAKYDFDAHTVLELLEAFGDDGHIGASCDADCGGVTLYGEESINVEHAAILCQAFMRIAAISKPIIFEWADYGSKNRVDEFGGGAVRVSQIDIEFRPSCLAFSPENEGRGHQPTAAESVSAANGGLWGDHPDFSSAVWEMAVTAGNERRGYWEWVASNLQGNGQDSEVAA